VSYNPFSAEVTPDWEAFVSCIKRERRPSRVHYIELFLDGEVQDVLCKRFNILDGQDPGDSYFFQQREVRLNTFLGYDFVRCGLGDTMTQDDVDRGMVIVIAGFAPLKPAEFVIVRIQQKVGQS